MAEIKEAYKKENVELTNLKSFSELTNVDSQTKIPIGISQEISTKDAKKYINHQSKAMPEVLTVYFVTE